MRKFFQLALFTLAPAICAAAATPCARYEAGSVLRDPEDLYSKNGVLETSFSYRSEVDSSGNTLYCFVNQDGAQSPTLHVHAGDRLVIHLKNQLTTSATGQSRQSMAGMAVMEAHRRLAGPC